MHVTMFVLIHPLATHVLAILATVWPVMGIVAMVSLSPGQCIRLQLHILYNHGHQTVDIDECAEETDNCAQLCNNTAGSYTCNCRTGYRLDSDGRSCNGN